MFIMRLKDFGSYPASPCNPDSRTGRALRLGVAGRLAFDALLGEIRDEVTLDFRVAA